MLVKQTISCKGCKCRECIVLNKQNDARARQTAALPTASNDALPICTTEGRNGDVMTPVER
jgi:hypothetical protein